MLLHLYTERDGGYRHIRGSFCSETRNQWGFESLSYGDPIDSLKIRSQINNEDLVKGSDKLYAIEVLWGGRDDLHGLEVGLKTLRMVARKIGRILKRKSFSGWIDDVVPNGQAFGVIAKAMKCSGVVLNGQVMSVNQGSAAIDAVLVGWLQEYRGQDIH